MTIQKPITLQEAKSIARHLGLTLRQVSYVRTNHKLLNSKSESSSMPRGGRRPGAGRPKGSPNKRSRQLSVAQAEVAAVVAQQGTTPLAHMMSVLNDPSAPPSRKDAMATAAAPYLHCRIATAPSVPPAGTNSGANTSTTGFTILSIGRGGRYCSETGQITFDDGTLATPEDTAFRPYKPTALLELQNTPTTVEPPEPLPIIEPEANADNVTPLAPWRRRDEPS